MLGTDVVVTKREGFAQRELQHFLRSRRERNLSCRHLVALADDPRDLRTDFLNGDVEGLEHPRRETLFLAKQAEQDVLGADVVVLERACFVLREDDYLACSFSETLEQGPSTPLSRGCHDSDVSVGGRAKCSPGVWLTHGTRGS